MRTFVLVCILALAGLTLQQAVVPSCGKFEVYDANGNLTKIRIKPKVARRQLQKVVVKTAPAYCAHRAHRRLQAIQEPSCANGRRLQARVTPTYCPVVKGWQCHNNTSRKMCP